MHVVGPPVLRINRRILGSTGVTLKTDRLPENAQRERACSTLVRVLEAHGGGGDISKVDVFQMHLF